ncbi:ImmA/IrrE family metallo-endopeptidase [Pseudonocardia sp. NPDC049154]|uniref:ImmA/IrrE family metallo-endopeptidase n=1 Tax=Pseudonocardia sp. NPDC049154 TaxID=3155501 RepID=UPI0033F3E1BE
MQLTDKRRRPDLDMGERWTQKKMIDLASEEREDLGLSPFVALNPFELAEHHGIPVYGMDSLASSPLSSRAVQHFSTSGSALWSAALIPAGRFRIIIENTAHTAERRSSSIAHELSHFFLEHEFDTTLLSEEKQCRNFDKQKENQAKFLSGELLIPQIAARKAAFRGLTNEEVAARFGVSTQFAQMQMAGARKYAQRALEKQGRQ